VSLSVPTTTVLVDQQVTISATLSDIAAPYEISWSTTSGTLNTTNSVAAVFTPPRRAGNVTINISVVKDDRILTAQVVFTVTVPDTTPPAAPTQVQALAGDNQVMLSWSGNNESDLASYKIFYGTTSGIYTQSVSVGTATRYTLTGLSNDTTYYFVVVATDSSGNQSAASAELSQAPTDGGAPDSPLDIGARFIQSSGVPSVVLSWLNPENSDLAGIMVRRKVGATAPVNERDGTLIYQTPTGSVVVETYADAAVTVGIQYSYSVFTYDEVPAYSAPSTVHIIAAD
jgi:chitodextrinase